MNYHDIATFVFLANMMFVFPWLGVDKYPILIAN